MTIEETPVMGIGLCLPQLGPWVNPDVIAEFARRSEELGYSSLWVQDHFMYPLQPVRWYGADGVHPPEQYKSVFSPLETLAYVAGITTRMKLGTSILVAGNHWPVSLAQRLATVDHMCSGRLVVGLGVGWNAEEHVASGTDVAHRGQRMDDFVPALLACWKDDPISYSGTFFDVPPCHVSPKPVQRPAPKLLSGMWSPAGLERTAKWFDAWNPASMPIERVLAMAARIDAMRSDSQAPIEIYYRSFIQAPLTPTTGDRLDETIQTVREAHRAGFTEVILEHNFWTDIHSAHDWLAIPERYASVVEAARS